MLVTYKKDFIKIQNYERIDSMGISRRSKEKLTKSINETYVNRSDTATGISSLLSPKEASKISVAKHVRHYENEELKKAKFIKAR